MYSHHISIRSPCESQSETTGDNKGLLLSDLAEMWQTLSSCCITGQYDWAVDMEIFLTSGFQKITEIQFNSFFINSLQVICHADWPWLWLQWMTCVNVKAPWLITWEKFPLNISFSHAKTPSKLRFYGLISMTGQEEQLTKNCTHCIHCTHECVSVTSTENDWHCRDTD